MFSSKITYMKLFFFIIVFFFERKGKIVRKDKNYENDSILEEIIDLRDESLNEMSRFGNLIIIWSIKYLRWTISILIHLEWVKWQVLRCSFLIVIMILRLIQVLLMQTMGEISIFRNKKLKFKKNNKQILMLFLKLC